MKRISIKIVTLLALSSLLFSSCALEYRERNRGGRDREYRRYRDRDRYNRYDRDRNYNNHDYYDRYNK